MRSPTTLTRLEEQISIQIMTWRNAVRFVAAILTALALVPAGAHLFELPNKIGLSQQDYFVVQNIYRGWSLFRFILLPAIVSDLVLTISQWGRRSAFWFALAGFLLISASLAVFLTWTLPANIATNNWTVDPDKLAAAPRAVGILACRRRDSGLPRALLGYCVSFAVIATLSDYSPDSLDGSLLKMAARKRFLLEPLQ